MEDVPYGRILREGWSIILICIVLCAGGAWGITRILPQTYTASSVLMLQVDSQDASLFEQNQFSTARIKTYSPLVDSSEVIDGVRGDLGLSLQAYSDGALREMLSAEYVNDSVLLKVVAEAPDATLASDLANSAAEHLSVLVEETENAGNSSGDAVILDQVLDAVPPAAPSSPNVTAITGLGLIAGFALGAIIAVFRTTTTRKLLSVADVRRASGLAVIGQIPRRRRGGADQDAASTIAFQETIGNLATLGGPERWLYTIVPASSSSLDDSTVDGLLEAYASTGTRAVVVDSREDVVSAERSRPLQSPAAAPEGTAGESSGADSSAYLTTGPVSSRHAVSAMVGKLEAMGQKHDVVLLLCDSQSPLLIERVANYGAGIVVAVRHNATPAADLNAVVTRQRVQGVEPLGVLMTNTARASTENVAETWRISDRDAPGQGEHQALERRGNTSRTPIDATVNVTRGRRAG